MDFTMHQAYSELLRYWRTWARAAAAAAPEPPPPRPTPVIRSELAQFIEAFSSARRLFPQGGGVLGGEREVPRARRWSFGRRCRRRRLAPCFAASQHALARSLCNAPPKKPYLPNLIPTL